MSVFQVPCYNGIRRGQGCCIWYSTASIGKHLRPGSLHEVGCVFFQNFLENPCPKDEALRFTYTLVVANIFHFHPEPWEYPIIWSNIFQPPSRILLENHICFRVQIFQPGLPWSSSTPVVSHKSHKR